jgi:hypothetical protein
LRRRRIFRLGDDHFPGGRGLLHDHDAARLAFDYAAGEQWQTDGDQNSFKQN